MKNNKKKFEKAIKKYEPITLSPFGISYTVEMVRRTASMGWKRILRTQSNNWLKMHGYPMKRKGR